VELRPCLDIRLPYRGHRRNAGFHGAYEGRAKAAALSFRLAEPVQDDQFDILIECALEQRADFGDSARIEPATLGLLSKVLGNPETAACRKVDERHRRTESGHVVRVLLQNPG
jgi:hypothetical protein